MFLASTAEQSTYISNLLLSLQLADTKKAAVVTEEFKGKYSEFPEMRVIKRKSSSSYGTPFTKVLSDALPEAKRSRLSELQLPPVSFGDSTELWELIRDANVKYQRSADIFRNHPVLSAQMRGILLDWIMDVCEAYTLHRETLHLSLDYLDRYLLAEKNILKNQLQLIGITCLFVASKIEEIYPPKLKIFSYVTDGACTEEQILDMELVLMKTLKWRLTPLTSTSYLNFFLQLGKVGFGFPLRSVRAIESSPSNSNNDLRLMKPSYNGVDFVRAARMLDLAALDVTSLKFSYSLLAAAALYHLRGKDRTTSITGFSWDQLAPCVHFMSSYSQVLRKNENNIPDVLPTVGTGGTGTIPDEERHLIQSHCVTLKMFEEAQDVAKTNKLCSPIHFVEGLLTPPSSTDKRVKVKRKSYSNNY